MFYKTPPPSPKQVYTYGRKTSTRCQIKKNWEEIFWEILKFFNVEEPSPPDEFECFPNLPTELRLEIWEAALPPPREIEIGPKMPHEEMPKRTIVPEILHVSREAREVALRRYTLRGYSNWWGIPTELAFNFEKDTLSFPETGQLSYLLAAPHKARQDWRNTGFWSRNGLSDVRFLKWRIHTTGQAPIDDLGIMWELYHLHTVFRHLQTIEVDISKKELGPSNCRQFDSMSWMAEVPCPLGSCLARRARGENHARELEDQWHTIKEKAEEIFESRREHVSAQTDFFWEPPTTFTLRMEKELDNGKSLYRYPRGLDPNPTQRTMSKTMANNELNSSGNRVVTSHCPGCGRRTE